MEQQQLEINSIKNFLAIKKSQFTSDQVLKAQSFLKEYDFHLLSLIDCGEFGLVIKAQDENNKRIVAIKLMIVQSPQVLQEALLEFQKAILFKHPHIAKNFQQLYDDENEAFFIISEYYSNGNFYDYARSRHLSEQEIKNIVKSIISAILEIHSKKMIHGDLKPQNILISSDNTIKVCDFGLSKIVRGQKSHTKPNGGSLCYMPTEQIKGEMRYESDTFALGCILCFLCGIFNDEDFMLMANFKNGEFPSINNHKYEKLLQLAIQMMRFQPKERISLNDALNSISITSIFVQENDEGKYEGELKDFMRNGRGIQIYNDSYETIKYDGEWLNDNRHGHGILEIRNGDKYEGLFKDSKKSGKGVYLWAEGSNCKKYDGEWLNGNRHGHGILEYRSGDKYEGLFKDGKFSGKGVYLWAEGASKKYDGEWLNNNKHGHGILEYRNGDKYEGQFNDNSMIIKNMKFKGINNFLIKQKKIFEFIQIKVTLAINFNEIVYLILIFFKMYLYNVFSRKKNNKLSQFNHNFIYYNIIHKWIFNFKKKQISQVILISNINGCSQSSRPLLIFYLQGQEFYKRKKYVQK